MIYRFISMNRKTKKFIALSILLIVGILCLSTPFGKYYAFNVNNSGLDLSNLEIRPLALFSFIFPFCLILESYVIRYPFSKAIKIIFIIQGLFTMGFVVWSAVVTFFISVLFVFAIKEINTFVVIFLGLYFLLIIGFSIWSILLATPLSKKRSYNWPFTDEVYEYDVKVSRKQVKEFKKKHRHGVW